MLSERCSYREAATIVGRRGGYKAHHKVMPKYQNPITPAEAKPLVVRKFVSETQLKLNLVT